MNIFLSKQDQLSTLETPSEILKAQQITLNGQNFLSQENQMIITFDTKSENIMDIFEEVSTHLNFSMIQRQNNYALAIKYYQNDFFNIFNCLGWLNKSTADVIKVTIQQGVNIDRKICKIRNLTPINNRIKYFYTEFSYRTKLYNTYEKQLFNTQDTQRQSNQQPYNPFHDENYALYICHKKLFDHNSKIGKKFMKDIDNIYDILKQSDISKEKISSSIKNIMKIIQNTATQLQKHLHMQNQQQICGIIIPYCRIIIQKIIFQKFMPIIQKAYAKKQITNQIIYKDKKKRIFEQYTLKDICQQLSFPMKFMFIKKQILVNKYSCQQTRKIFELNDICQQLQKIKLTTNPRQKIKCCQQAYIKMKSLFHEKTNRKYQIFSMQQIIPITILLILLVDIQQLKSDIQIMNQFLVYDPYDGQSQKRLLLNMKESFNYIVRDWNI